MRADERYSSDSSASGGTIPDSRHLVTFSLGSEEFGIDIGEVQEINRMVPITHVPRTVAYMEGVINLRGQLIPVIDLRTRFGMPRVAPTRNSRIIVVDVKARRIGMVVDSVAEVVHIPLSDIEPTPEIINVAHADFLESVGKIDTRLIILLNVTAIASSEALV